MDQIKFLKSVYDRKLILTSSDKDYIKSVVKSIRLSVLHEIYLIWKQKHILNPGELSTTEYYIYTLCPSLLF